LSRGSWLSLPASLSSVLTDVDGCGTDLGVFLAAADLLVSRRRIPRPMCSSTPPTCSKKRSRPATAPAPARPSCRRTDAVGRGREPATSPPLHKPLQSLQRTETSMADPAPRFGFVDFAETWNGRLAMLGFVIGLATELLTGQGILQQIGLG
jgi:hypothetical protein